METWEVISYDVWGNDKDGYEVNQSFYTGKTIEIPEGASKKEVVKALKDIEFLAKHVKYSKVEIEGDDYSMYLTKTNMYPLCELRRKTPAVLGIIDRPRHSND